jgi:hypothetical protein
LWGYRLSHFATGKKGGGRCHMYKGVFLEIEKKKVEIAILDHRF